MTVPVSRVSRAVRAAMFAAVCVSLAVVGHVATSGTGLSWPVLILAAAGVTLTGWLVAGRERGHFAVISLTLAVQACLHVSFTVAQSSRPASSAMSPQHRGHLFLCGNATPQQAQRAYDLAVESGMTHSTHRPAAHGGMTTPSGTGGMHHMDGMTGTVSWGMLAAHVVAALLCGLWLAQGERVAFRLLRLFAERAFVPLRLVLAVPPLPAACLRPCRPATTVRRLRSWLLVHALAIRGPPGVPAVA
ncbi:hypothetical protein ACFWN1_08390 [Streptomyces sp. NPDC058459]|uniref:hypothetical protein n=1 Tax=Streptomyces sp. NPDC058459 TaxID=3346508 RepID=UPI00365410E0